MNNRYKLKDIRPTLTTLYDTVTQTELHDFVNYNDAKFVCDYLNNLATNQIGDTLNDTAE